MSGHGENILGRFLLSFLLVAGTFARVGAEDLILHAFSCTIHYPPESGLNPRKTAEELLSKQRRTGMTREEATANLPELIKAFEKSQRGFVAVGDVDVSFYPGGSLVRAFIPRLNGGTAIVPTVEDYNGEVTLQKGFGLHVWIHSGDEREKLSRAGDCVALTGELPHEPDRIEPIGADKATAVSRYRYRRQGKYPEVLTLKVDLKGRIYEAVSELELPTGRRSIDSKYFILGWSEHRGRLVPSHVEILRGLSKDSPIREEYIRKGTAALKPPSLWSLIEPDEFVIDMRLGTTKQVGYPWKGKVLSLSDLETSLSMRQSIVSREHPWPMLGVIVGLGMIATGAIARRRNRTHLQKT